MYDKREGILFYDGGHERYDIRYGIDEYYGGLHCGDCFDVLINEDWIPTRIEHNDDLKWYLVGISHDISLQELKVRM